VKLCDGMPQSPVKPTQRYRSTESHSTLQRLDRVQLLDVSRRHDHRVMHVLQLYLHAYNNTSDLRPISGPDPLS